MKNQTNDWRLRGQEECWQGETLVFKNYSDRKTKTDHDHCEFCFDKFSDAVFGSLNTGYTTKDDYHWICEKCFADFKDRFNWTIEKSKS